MDPSLTHDLVRAYESVWGAGLRAPELNEQFAGFDGLVGMGRYFATRAAPLGPVPAEVVVATFYNFGPDAVRPHIPSAWAIASPQQYLDAEKTAVGRALERAFAPLPAGLVKDAAATVREAALAAAEHPEGRVLFAARAALPWPEEPHEILWHGHMMLREYRGDAHIAVLVSEGLSGPEAFALHLATGPDLPADLWRPSRSWSAENWEDALDGLRTRGWLTSDELTATEQGQQARDAIEHATDLLDTAPYEAIGEAGRNLLLSAARAIGEALDAAGLGLFGTPMYKRADMA